MQEKIGGKISPWGKRLNVPARVMNALGLEIGDEVEWEIKGEEAILRKKKRVEEEEKK